MKILRPTDDDLVVRTCVRERFYGVLCILVGITILSVNWLEGDSAPLDWLVWPMPIALGVILLPFLAGGYLLLLTRETTFRRDSPVCERSLSSLRWRLPVHSVTFHEIGIHQNGQGPDSAVMLYTSPGNLARQLTGGLFGVQVADFGARRPAEALAKEIRELTGVAVQLH